ncbi:MAG: L-ribulose-5-phosphate 3-epimerase [Anaerolineales bacterium]
MVAPTTMPVGIYEKALPAELSWEQRLDMASSAGYNFLEMSIDESEERLARLTWPPSERAKLREAISNTGVPVLTMGVSGHRKYPLGSASSVTRGKAEDMLYREIELAADIGVKIIQIMGYDVFYETSDEDTQRRYLEGLKKGAQRAGTVGVMLGLENVDVEFVNSVEKAMGLVRAVDSPWFNIYPDMGNLIAAGNDPVSQLRLAEGHIVAIHVKDAVPGVYRGVAFESGTVPLRDVFRTLAEIGFWGPMVVEMWAHMQPGGNALEPAIQARKLVDQLISSAWKL